MKKIVKIQKEITNDLGFKQNIDLLIAIDNVKLIQYTCPSRDFYSVDYEDLIIFLEDNELKVSKTPIEKNVVAVITWFKYHKTQIIKLFLKDDVLDNDKVYDMTLRKVFKYTNISNFGEKLLSSLN